MAWTDDYLTETMETDDLVSDFVSVWEIVLISVRAEWLSAQRK